MILMVILLSITTDFAQCSGTHHGVQEAIAPVVTAASSQYFERIFNRLVAAQPVIPAAPVQPVFEPVIPVAPTPPVIVEATRTFVPVVPTNSPQNDPNIAIAIATAHAAAPVATILLPPYPFGFPPNIASIPQPDNTNLPNATPTQTTTTQTTTETEQEMTTPVSSDIDNSFAQALPSNQNINFKLYGQPILPPPAPRPQKLKTTVEIVPVPLTYIAPPPIASRHHHHHGHHHQALKVPHIHTFLPKTRILIKPISSPLRLRSAPLISRPFPNFSRKSFVQQPQILRPRSRETEPTTFKPVNGPILKPPRL